MKFHQEHVVFEDPLYGSKLSASVISVVKEHLFDDLDMSRHLHINHSLKQGELSGSHIFSSTHISRRDELQYYPQDSYFKERMRDASHELFEVLDYLDATIQSINQNTQALITALDKINKKHNYPSARFSNTLNPRVKIRRYRGQEEAIVVKAHQDNTYFNTFLYDSEPSLLIKTNNGFEKLAPAENEAVGIFGKELAIDYPYIQATTHKVKTPKKLKERLVCNIGFASDQTLKFYQDNAEKIYGSKFKKA